MPLPVLKSYAHRAKTSLGHVEQVWERAKQIALQRFKTDKAPGYWAYVNGIVKKDLKLEGLELSDFVEPLTEVFDAPPKLYDISSSARRFECFFDTGEGKNKKIRVHIYLDDFDVGDSESSVYTIEFSRYDEDRGEQRFNDTKTGDSIKVFAGVIEAIKQFLRTPAGRRAEDLYFTTDKSATSRTSLYTKLVKRYLNELPGFELNVDDKHADADGLRLFKLSRHRRQKDNAEGKPLKLSGRMLEIPIEDH